MWPGGSDQQQEGNYSWHSGEGWTVDATLWAPGEPNNMNNNEHCVLIGYSDTLNDERCTESIIGFMCEMSLNWTEVRLNINKTVKSSFIAFVYKIQATRVKILQTHVHTCKPSFRWCDIMKYINYIKFDTKDTLILNKCQCYIWDIFTHYVLEILFWFLNVS